LDENALIPDKNLVSPPPNQFTHELTRPQPFFFDRATEGGPAAGQLAAATKVVLMVYDGGTHCRVIDGRGLYVELAYDCLRRL